MNILITGSNGFIAKNLKLFLDELNDVQVVQFNRDNNLSDLERILETIDIVFHCAGVNRPLQKDEYKIGNSGLTRDLIDSIHKTGRKIPVIYTSSTQASNASDYGISKREAEDLLFEFQKQCENPVHVFRLPNVFGKWCKPNYNSVVATFCYNIARDKPITINDPNAKLSLVYIDDLIDEFIHLLESGKVNEISIGVKDITRTYQITVGELSSLINSFKDSRTTLISPKTGNGLTRALYSTYISYLPTNLFAYKIQKYTDPRGDFVEMLKTPESGQFSYFTAAPGVTRGGHFHHTKTEKFLVIKGTASFRFRNESTDERYALITSGTEPVIVETVPGWTHDIKNVGDEELIVMLWANEIFNRLKPDTFARSLD